MKVYQIHFSPTGGTAKVASLLAQALGEAGETVDLSAPDFAGCEIPSGCMAVIAMPSFGGRAPKTAIDRLKLVRGNGAAAVAVAVYGNRAQEDTLLEIADTAQECGFTLTAGIAAVAEHSIARQYGTGRPDPQDAAQLKAFAAQILSRPADAPAPKLPGEHPYKKAGAGLVPKGTAACTGCGLCAAKCPSGAIDKAAPRLTDKAKCINCMRCVANCPQNARAVSGLMVKAVGAALKKACTERKENQLYI